MLAGAQAARGAVAAADRQLRTAAGAADEAARPWFCNSVLLLAAASGRRPGPPPSWLLADTTSGGLLAGGLWAAMTGDTSTARARLALLQRRPSVQLRRLGQGPTLLRAYSLAADGRWSEVTRQLGAAALAGERDGGDLDQVSGMALRWLMADAYDHTGKADSAAAMYELVLDPTRTPFSHIALRGLVHSFASRRLAVLYDRMGRPEAAAPHWKAFRSAFVTPDRELRALVAEAP